MSPGPPDVLQLRSGSGDHSFHTPAPSHPVSHPQEPEAAIPGPHVLKVHHKYTVALQVKPGLSYRELLDLVCKKVELQPEHTELRLGPVFRGEPCFSELPHLLTACLLRYKPAESQALVTLSTENLGQAWSQSKDNCLTVWCDITEVSDGSRWRPPLPPAPGKEPQQMLPLLSLP